MSFKISCEMYHRQEMVHPISGVEILQISIITIYDFGAMKHF